MSEHHLFYKTEIVRDQQEEYINSLLKEYQSEEATEELKEKIYERLMWEKHLGNVTIPFTVTLNQDPFGRWPDEVQVLLDTRV